MTTAKRPAGSVACAKPGRPPKESAQPALDQPEPDQPGAESGGKLSRNWRGHFLAALAETSNVTASAARARVSPSRAYKLRRDDAEFSAQWRQALHEGYDHLEMDVLAYLRSADPARKMDVCAGR